MTDSPSDTETTESTLDAYAADFASAVGAESWSTDFDTIHVYITPDQWVEAATYARDEAGLGFFSWLSAVDWAKEVEVGEPVDDVENLEERFEVLCCLSSPVDASAVILSTSLGKDHPSLDTLVPVYSGAAWHERETAEMFGIDFPGHPNLIKLYLPQEFEGHPLRKSFALGARIAKPWPGTVDVEELPSTENVEAGEGSE
ncbi:MAG: NADH-quinone oxidoreductase subunit C [Acidimicrobiia bacterium]|nr:NADH-quinone oxidoreductase subunit C [Acidimicrobiia bacterium]